MKSITTLALLVGLGLGVSTAVQAKGRLVVYCSATNTFCEAEVNSFSKKYDVKTSFTRASSGSTLAKISAEKDNPRGDVWYGGPIDSHNQAADLNLLEAYQSPNLKQIAPEFRDPGKKKGNYSSAIYLGILGFGYNRDRIETLGIEAPKCWADLVKPEYRSEVQMADPQSSGTAYIALVTFVQLWGKNAALDYLKSLNRNISQYTKSGAAPARNAARGESAIAITMLHDQSVEIENGAPLEIVIPCEGTGYELGGVSLIKDARNSDNAKLFIDWALSKEAQEVAWKEGKGYQSPTNITAEVSPLTLDYHKVNLVNYDSEKNNETEIKTNLIDEWLKKVKMAN